MPVMDSLSDLGGLEVATFIHRLAFCGDDLRMSHCSRAVILNIETRIMLLA